MSTDSIVFAFSKESSKDFGKKKRTNRTAKLKQCKLDARREQWLSQVKNKGGKEEPNGGSGSGSASGSSVPPLGNPRPRGKDVERLSLNDSDVEGSINSSVNSILGSHDLSKDSVGSSRGSSVSSVSGGCYCESGEEEEAEGEEEDGDADDECADDWEAVADALTADDKQQQLNLANLAPVVSANNTELLNKNIEVDESKPQCDKVVSRPVRKGHAWRPDDAFRPQSLPTLSKQFSFPMSTDRCYARAAGNWVHGGVSQPTSCPICYEDLDLTDSSFQPCLCGFRLCLFCHKRILEADGRCPGCRKHYESAKGEAVVNGGAPPFQFSRSVSMSTRS